MGVIKIIIRKMLEGDLNAVIELAILANPFTTTKEYYKHLLDELKENPDLSFVAIENGKVVGYIQADVLNDEAELEDIAVTTEFQGKGIGSCLLDTVLKALMKKEVKTVHAEVHFTCAAAIPFFYKHDFRITRVERNFFGNGHDAIILKLLLR